MTTGQEPPLVSPASPDAAAAAPAPEAAQNPPAPSRGAQSQSFWQYLVELYGTADPRSLGLLRIALGTLMFFDVLRRWPDVEAHYANTGWLTNHFALFRPMSNYLLSFYLAFGSPAEVKFFMSLHLLVCVLLIVGYRTKLMQVLGALLIISISSRNILLENGGWVVLNILSVWSAFLPLGRRFSVDALLASLRARKETRARSLSDPNDPPRDVRPVHSLAVTALIFQYAIIYYFNVVHKSGAPWRDGTAVYYFFQQDRMVTALGGILRDYLPVSVMKGMTFSTLVMESAIAALLVLPWRPHITRMVAWLLVCALHLSIDLVVQLGPFSWAMVVAFFAFIPRQFWEGAARYLERRRTPCTVLFDKRNGALLGFCRLLKRFDALGLVTYEAVRKESPEAERAKAAFTVRQGDTLLTGFDALRAVAGALWFGDKPLRLFGALGGRAFLERKVNALVSDGRRISERLGLLDLPNEDDARAPEPSEAQRFVGRVGVAFRELGVLAFMIACGSQVLMENRAIPPWLKVKTRPEFLTAMVVYPRMFQGWSMFAPQPPNDDGRVVVDGRTRDGRAFDPLTGTAPSFEVQPKGGYRMNQIWGDFHRRIAEDRFRQYWGGFREFLQNHHKLTGKPEDELVAFDVYFVSETIPPPGGPVSTPSRRKLFSQGIVKPATR